MRPLLALLLTIPLAACGDDGPDVDFGGEDLGEDRFAVHTDDGGVRMGLTDRFVYFALSDSVMGIARTEMRQDTPDGGLGGAISGFVRGTVDRALQFRARYSIGEIRDIRWEDGRMVFDFVDPDRSLDNSFRVDERPVQDAFREEDVEAFGAAFRALKAERGSGG